MDIYEVVGWIGAVLVITGYAMVTRLGTSRLYHVVNVLGAAGLLVNAVRHGAFPATAVNVVWAFIAIWGIALTGRRRTSA
jgi:hypothetical protein